jgi:hypothetical protein
VERHPLVDHGLRSQRESVRVVPKFVQYLGLFRAEVDDLLSLVAVGEGKRLAGLVEPLPDVFAAALDDVWSKDLAVDERDVVVSASPRHAADVEEVQEAREAVGEAVVGSRRHHDQVLGCVCGSHGEVAALEAD